MKEDLLRLFTVKFAERKIRMNRLFDSVIFYNIDFCSKRFPGAFESITRQNAVEKLIAA